MPGASPILAEADRRAPPEARGTGHHIDVGGAGDFDRLGWPGARDDDSWNLYAFQCREFLDVWARTIGAARRWELLLVRVSDAAGRPVLFLPLALERRAGLRVLRFPDGGVADYGAPALRADRPLDAATFRALWPRILDALPAADLVYLTKVAARVLDAENPLLGLGVGEPQGLGTFIGVAQSFDDYAADQDRKAALSQNARKRQRLVRQAALGIHEDSAAAGPTAACVDFVIAHKRRQYLRTLGTDVLALPGIEAFFREVAQPENLGRIGHLSHLEVSGRIAAAHLGYATARRFYYILPATDFDGFGKLSPGSMLFEAMTRRAFALGLPLDLGIGEEPYKARWITDRMPLHAHLMPLTARGRIAALALKARRSPALRRLWGAQSEPAGAA